MADATTRRSLPLVTDRGAHAGRSPRTCSLKCGSACFHEAPNRSDNPYFGDIVEQSVGRRSVLKGGAALLLAGAVGTGTVAGAAPVAARAGPVRRSRGTPARGCVSRRSRPRRSPSTR